MPIRAVVLDFYGTLAEAVPGEQPELHEVLAARGYRVEPDRSVWMDESWDGIDHRQHSTSEEAYRLHVRGRRRSMLDALGVGGDDVDAVLDDLEVWAGSFRMRAYPDTGPVLEALRERGLALAVCSNWDWDLDTFLDQAGLAGRVDLAVTSARAGWRKPHPEIFRHTLDLLGVAAAEALFVGDTWRADVEGARRAGLRPVHLWREDEHTRARIPAAPELPEGVARITTLDQLLDLI